MHRSGDSGEDARRLALALTLILAFMAAEVVVGVLAHSLALLSDAAHMLTDAGALAMSLVVLRLAAQPVGGNRTFGLHRSEILSAQANGAALLVLAGLIVYGAVRRLVSPPHANGTAILVVALVGIGVNLLATWQVAGANRGSLNIEGSFQHLLNDLFAFEARLSVDEVEDEIREDQNSHFIQGKAVHTFEELTAILDYMPAGYDTDEEAPAKGIEDEEDADLPELVPTASYIALAPFVGAEQAAQIATSRPPSSGR